MSVLAWMFLPIFGFLVGAWSAREAHRRSLRDYLDRAITSWRLEQRRYGTDAERALHYIDALQSVRMSMLGELLPLMHRESGHDISKIDNKRART